MLSAIKRLFAKTQNKVIVKAAVEKGWITVDDYATITGEVYA